MEFNLMKKHFLILFILLQYSYSSDIFYYNYGKKEYLYSYENLSSDNSNIDYYQNQKGLVVGINNRLLVKFKNNDQIGEILEGFNLLVERQLGKTLFILKVPSKNVTIDIANQLNQNINIEYAQPDFIKKRFKR
jgi:hypothetical protein